MDKVTIYAVSWESSHEPDTTFVLTEDDAIEVEDYIDEKGFKYGGYFPVETYDGANIHTWAVGNSKDKTWKENMY